MAEYDRCGPRVRVYYPTGFSESIDLGDLGAQIADNSGEEMEDLPGGDPLPPGSSGKVWNEASRNETTIDVNGVSINRIKSIQFEDDNGNFMQLNMA